jgi:hypothetical protein
MKRFTKHLLALFFLFFFLGATPAFAHVILSSGSINALLHINPDDKPVAGQNSELLFVIKDKQNKFSLSDCACGVEISQNGTVKESGELKPTGNNQDGSYPYVFPEKAVYQIKLVGKPIEENTFQPFTLNFDIRVEHDTNDRINPLTQPLIIVCLVVIVAVFCIILFTHIKIPKNNS